MLFSLLYWILRRVLGTGRRPQDERDIELLVLRHQVKVLLRHVKRPPLHRLDRVLLAAASRAMQRNLWSSFLVGRRHCSGGTVSSSPGSGPTRGGAGRDGRPWTPRSGTSLSASTGRTPGGVTSGSGASG